MTFYLVGLHPLLTKLYFLVFPLRDMTPETFWGRGMEVSVFLE
jgi:hypothetical protein